MASGEGEEVEVQDQIEKLQNIDPIAFEEFCAALWERFGWDTAVTKSSSDAGVDVYLYRNDSGLEQRAVLQAKRYDSDNHVSSTEVQQYGALLEQEDAENCIVVTTSYFSEPARGIASDIGMDLIDGSDLQRLIEEAEATDLVAEYVPSVTEQSSPETKDSSETDPGEKVSKLKSRLGKPSKFDEYMDAIAWAYIWNPGDKTVALAIPAFIGAAIFGLGGYLFGDVVIWATIGAIVFGLATEFALSHLTTRGRPIVRKYDEPIYDHYVAKLEECAREEVGVTNPGVSVYSTATELHGNELVSNPRKYKFKHIVVTQSSIGIVIDSMIYVPKIKYSAGTIDREIFYDQVAQLEHGDGDLTIQLADDSELSFPLAALTDEARNDLSERIRVYK